MILLSLKATGKEGPLGYEWIKVHNLQFHRDKKTQELSILCDCEVPQTKWNTGWSYTHWCDIVEAIECGEYTIESVNTDWIGEMK